ncbi:unnamed protein product, partial [Sphenostylis stenocarpa]
MLEDVYWPMVLKGSSPIWLAQWKEVKITKQVMDLRTENDAEKKRGRSRMESYAHKSI